MSIATVFKIGALAFMGAGGLAALISSGKPEWAMRNGQGGMLIGSVLACVWLFFEPTPVLIFQVPIIILAIAGAIHSSGYLRGHGVERAGYYWFFYALTVMSMLGVTLASTKINFLIFWEMMGLASFALVAFDRTSEEIRDAAWTYLLACEAGALFLIPMFFMQMGLTAQMILAIIGFGLKIGFPLLHVWLPKAHPAAPAPVSALMSGAMIQLGFYGLIFCFRHTWGSLGYFLLVLGLIGAPCGILLAMPRRNLKALLAYSSVENMGILSISMGLGIIGFQMHLTSVTVCACAGFAIHVLNHTLLKGGLFLGAGSVLKGAHTLDIDELGGLMKRMPKTGGLFLVNACSLSGLPPFSGFMGEFLIYLAALYSIIDGTGIMPVIGCVVFIVMAFTGGVAAAVYAKAIGGVFLGEPRSEHAAQAGEVPASMNASIVFLFILSLLVLLAAPWIIDSCVSECHLFTMLASVAFVSLIGMLLFCIFFYSSMGKFAKSRSSVTWDCGFSKPDARMEYTGTAFTQPLCDFFHYFLNLKKKPVEPQGLFPEKASYVESCEDPAYAGYRKGLFGGICRLADKVHHLQSGSLHFYILIMTIALILLLVWGLLLPWSGNVMKGGF